MTIRTPANGKSKPASLKIKDLTSTAKDRELWLNKVAAKFVRYAEARLKAHNKANPDSTLPEVFPAFRVCVGSLSKSLADYYDKETGAWKGGHYGSTWHHSVSGDNRFEVVLSLCMGSMRDVLDTLAHEAIHVIDQNEHGHEKVFQQICTVVGLTAGPKSQTNPEGGTTWTNALCGEDLLKEMTAWTKTKAIGKYPHAGFFGKNTTLDIGTGSIIFGGGFASSPVRPAGARPAQKNYYRKATCPTSGCTYVVRATKKVLEMALPICGACHAKTAKVVHMTLDAVESAALDGTDKPGRPKGGSKAKAKAKAKPTKAKAKHIKVKHIKVKVGTVTAVKVKAPRGTAFRNLRVGEVFTREETPGVEWTKAKGGTATWTTPDGKVVTSPIKGTEVVVRVKAHARF